MAHQAPYNLTRSDVWWFSNQRLILTPSSPRYQKKTLQLTSAANGVVAVVPSQFFHILIFSSSAKQVDLAKYMVVAYVTGRPTSVMSASSYDYYQPPMGALRSLNRSALSNDTATNSAAEQNTVVSEALHANNDNINNPDSAVHYQTSTDWQLQIEKYIGKKQAAANWVKINKKPRSFNICTISFSQETIHRNAVIKSIHVKWPLWRYQRCEAPCRAASTRHTSSTLSIELGKP